MITVALDVRSDSAAAVAMVIYKIHQLRVLTVAILLTLITMLLLLLNAPQKCVQVSVSVRRQWRPVVFNRTRVVQGVDPIGKQQHSDDRPSSSWFRTRIILPSFEDEGQENQRIDEYDSETNDGYGADEYYEEDLSENKIFEDGDFDYNDTGSKSLEPDFSVILRIFQDNTTYSNVNGTPPELSKYYRKSLGRRNTTIVNVEGMPIVEDGIFWSDELERRAPKGETDGGAETALRRLRSLNVQRVEPPTWNRCGRPKNQFVVFEDGSKACARYRAPHQYLVQGEVLSFYLSRLLGINNVPVVSLAAVGPDFRGTWGREAVRRDLIASKWEVNTTVALIQWIDNLERDKMPLILLPSLENKEPPLSAKSSSLLTLLTKKLTELLQWSDLILFDYITGNYDRVASMQDAADKEGKPSILQETVHNLVRSKSTGGLWLIDNESGLLDSYSLLYGTASRDGRFIEFHRRMLNATCLFRRRTVERIRWLHTSNRAGQVLMGIVKQLEPLFTPVKREKEVGRRLQQRIGEVHEHIEQCLASVS